MDLVKLVEERLPQAPARVLEVGCGEGDLARPSLASAIGYLYGDLGGAEVERVERALIEEGAIRGIGFSYVGEA
jgi:hypothetical protein